jgi:hypothetical protein
MERLLEWVKGMPDDATRKAMEEPSSIPLLWIVPGADFLYLMTMYHPLSE